MSRWRAPVVVLTAMVLLGLASPPPPNAHSQSSSPLQVEISRLEPLQPAPGGTITLGGAVTNVSAEEVLDVRVRLRVSPEPLVSRSQVASVTEQTTGRTGVAVLDSSADLAARLAPGAKSEFLITTSTASLPLGPNGVYAVFVEALSDRGSARAALPVTWFPDPEAVDPSRLVVTTPVRAGVDLSVDERLDSDALVESLAPGGDLHAFATAGAALAKGGVPVTWLVDPAVVEAANGIAEGRVAWPGAADAGVPAAQAASWAAELRAGLEAPSSEVHPTPYAEVDGPAVVAARLPDLLDRSITWATGTAALPGSRGVVAPVPGGDAGPRVLQEYARGSLEAVLMPDAAWPPAERVSYTPNAAADIELPDGRTVTALLWDQLLADQWDRPSESPAQRLLVETGVLAQSAMITLELPIASRTVLMLPPAGRSVPGDLYFGTIAALARSPYIELVGLQALLDPSQAPRIPRSGPVAQPGFRQLPPGYFSPVPSLEQRLASLGEITVGPLRVADDYQRAMLRASSANWRTDVAAGQELFATIEAGLTDLESMVSTVSTGTVTFTGSRGTLPLTIANGLAQAVRVGIELQAEPAFRMAYTPPDLQTVEAGKRVSVEIPVEVFGSGPVPVAVVLTDPMGRPFVRSAELTLRSTGASLVAAAIAVAGAMAFVSLLLWRFRRRGAHRGEPRG